MADVLSTERNGAGSPVVLIAGGGVAALEAMLALRHLAGERVKIEIIAPERDFSYRPLAVAEPFGIGGVRRFDLARLTAEQSVVYRPDAVTSVDPVRRKVDTLAGAELDYDALLLALGAKVRVGLPGAMTFWGTGDTESFRELLAKAEGGLVRKLVFALPVGVGWPLPLYELALLTSAHLIARGIDRVELTLVTPESAPLELFGARASEQVRALLKARGIGLRCGCYPRMVEEDEVLLASGGVIKADHVVSVPRLEGPFLPGVPHDRCGFIPTDSRARVAGLENVYAAGDATTFPVKQGGMAAQQADAAAEAIAAWAGAPVQPQPFQGVLRGLLLTGAEPTFLRDEISGGKGETSVPASHALWWPPGKIAGKYLAPHLAARAKRDPQPPPSVGRTAVEIEVDIGQPSSV